MPGGRFLQNRFLWQVPFFRLGRQGSSATSPFPYLNSFFTFRCPPSFRRGRVCHFVVIFLPWAKILPPLVFSLCFLFRLVFEDEFPSLPFTRDKLFFFSSVYKEHSNNDLFVAVVLASPLGIYFIPSFSSSSSFSSDDVLFFFTLC